MRTFTFLSVICSKLAAMSAFEYKAIEFVTTVNPFISVATNFGDLLKLRKNFANPFLVS